jgi:SAM-dependent methyltransferase
MKCLICGSGAVERLDKKVMGADSAKVNRCPECGFAFLSGVELPGDFYEKKFDAFMAGRSRDSSRRDMEKNFHRCLESEAPERIKLLSGSINLDETNSVLELGSSTGFMLEALKTAFPGIRAEGVEPGAAAREYSRSRGHHVYSSLEEAEGNYSLITSFFVLEHIPDPHAWLESFIPWMAPGGRIAMIVPNINEALVREFEDPHYDAFVWQAPHTCYFSSQSLKMLFDKYFSRTEVINYQRYSLSNHFNWLSGLKPEASKEYGFLGEELNRLYKKTLEEHDRSDTLMAIGELKGGVL